MSPEESQKPKKVPYKYGMTDPSAAFVARVWKVVEDKVGFTLGPRTKNALQPRIKELYLMKLDSSAVGEIVHHEWRMHRDMSRRIREMAEKLERYEAGERPQQRQQHQEQRRPSVTIVRKKEQPREPQRQQEDDGDDAFFDDNQ